MYWRSLTWLVEGGRREVEGVKENAPSHFWRGAVEGLRPMRDVKLKKLRHDAPDLSPSATLCIWFAVMIIFAKFRALDILRHGRGDKGDGIGLVVGLGG